MDRFAPTTASSATPTESRAPRGRTPQRLIVLAVSLLMSCVGLVALPGAGGAAFAANPQGFSTLLSHNPRAFTLTGTTCTATVGFVFDNEANYQRIGGVNVACGSRYATITARVVVQYTPTQYYNASTSAYYSPAGVTVSNATAPSAKTFYSSYGFTGILDSPGVCRGTASHSIFYVGATVIINGASYNLNSWGYWNPNSGC
jgi:hypothetical protein